MKLTRIAPGHYRDNTTGIEIKRENRYLGVGRDITEWVATAPAVGGRTWLTTGGTLREVKSQIGEQ